MNSYVTHIEVPYPLTFNTGKYKNQKQTTCIDLELDKKFHDWLKKEFNLVVQWSEVFYLKPYDTHGIHCDGEEIDNKSKLNFIVGGQNSTMIWYEPVDPEKIIKKNTAVNTVYLSIETSNAKELFRKEISGLNLVNVGCFHNVKTMNAERFCLSMCLVDNTTNIRLSYTDLVNRFLDHIIN
jgi:hypothetical protein